MRDTKGKVRRCLQTTWSGLLLHKPDHPALSARARSEERHAHSRRHVFQTVVLSRNVCYCNSHSRATDRRALASLPSPEGAL